MRGAADRAQNLNDEIDAQHGAQVSELEAVALRTTTVYPSQDFGGLVVAGIPNFDGRGATPLYLRVNFLGENHLFYFQAHKPGIFVPAAIDQLVVADEVQNGTKPAVAFTPIQSPAANLAPQIKNAATVQPQPAFRRLDDWEKANGKSSNDD